MKGKAGLRKADKIMISVFQRLAKKQPICKVFMKATLRKSAKSNHCCSVYEHGRKLTKLFDEMICPEEYYPTQKEESLFTIGILYFVNFHFYTM